MDDVTLRRRADGSLELRVNGIFVMDDVETSSERLLAEVALADGARDLLVGGLGLGFTLRTLLASNQVDRVVVAELHPEVVALLRDGAVPGADLLDDPRVELVVDDVRAVVAARSMQSLDAILLDVDNGPGFLVHDTNFAVYEPSFIATCARRLRAEGRLHVWSMAPSPALTSAVAACFEEVVETSVPVRLQQRAEHYWIVGGARPTAR